MSEKKLVPKIRFPGFTDDWEQRKLGDLVEFYNGDRSSRYPTDKDMVQNGIPFINAGDIVDGRIKLDTANKISKEKYNELSGAKIQLGDIIYCLRGTLGKNAYIDNIQVGTVASSLVDIRPKKICGKYLFQVLNSNVEYKQRVLCDEGAAQPNLSAKNLSKFDIPVPNKEEQETIALFFDKIDKTITLHQNELSHYVALKTALLQILFPIDQNGIPKKRFHKYNDPWKLVCLDQIADVRDGTHDSPQYVTEGYPLVTAKNLKEGKINYNDIQYISRKDFESINKRSKVDKYDILMGMIGTIGNLALITEETNFAIKNVALIKNTGQINYNFLFQFLQSPFIKNQLAAGFEGGTQKFYSLNKIRKLPIFIPSEEEQMIISNFLMKFDQLIDLKRKKITDLKTLKQGLLQQMFV